MFLFLNICLQGAEPLSTTRQTNAAPVKVPLWTAKPGYHLVTDMRRDAWINLQDGRKVKISLPVLVEKPLKPQSP